MSDQMTAEHLSVSTAPTLPRTPLLHALAALGTAIALALGLDAIVGRIVPGMSRSAQSAVVSAELVLESLFAGAAVWFYARRTRWTALDLGLRRPRNGMRDAVAAVVVTWVISVFAAGAYSYLAFPEQHAKVTVHESCADGATHRGPAHAAQEQPRSRQRRP